MDETIRELRDLSRLLPSGDRRSAVEALGEAPVAPRLEEFDLDGDRGLIGIESEAYSAATERYRAALDDYRRRRNIATRLAGHAAAVHLLDTDGDARLSADEWDAGLARLRAERAARLFARFYDADGDGRVGDAEIGAFMDAYEVGGMHADADMNGRVDRDDLVYFRDRVVGE